MDSVFSLEPHQMKSLVEESQRAWQALGQVSYGSTEKEKKSMMFRRSIYITRNMKAGEILSPENLRAIRPGLGLPPKYFDDLIGRTVKGHVPKGTPVSWALLN